MTILKFSSFFTIILILLSLKCSNNPDGSSLEHMAANFANPPQTARPGAFWCWLNGNMTKEAITRDLEEMKTKGMNRAEIWDVAAIRNPDFIPAGGPFLGDESVELIKHAIAEGRRLKMRIGIIASSGWNAGGSWVTPDWASKSLFFSETDVKGPGHFTVTLPFPKFPENCPMKDEDTPIFYKDIAVLAVPKNDSKTIKYSEGVLDLTSKFHQGILEWDAPQGEWTILRFVCSNNGQSLIVPSPNSDGLFIDFLDPEATKRHLQYFMDRLGVTPSNSKESGLGYFEFDSMELTEDIVWTDDFATIFRQNTGYDIEKYLPILAGWKMEDITGKFLYDYQKTVSDQLIYSHYQTGSEFLESYHADLVAEAGGPGPPIWNTCPVDALKALGNVSVPRGEFWIKHRNMFLVKQIASASHIYGKKIVDAESFTTWRRWKDSPFELKKYADRAFCEGLNNLTFHTFASTNPEDGFPGRTYHAGLDINPGTTWWEKSKPFMDYLSRCSYMLQQGLFVADACYYYGDQAPNFFPAYHDVPEKPMIPGLDKGYDFDVVNSDVILNRMSVKDGRIMLPDGMNYRVMLLPDQDHMSLEILEKLAQLVREGATIIGNPPKTVPGLKDFQEKNTKLNELAAEMWGKADGNEVFQNSYGKGRVIRGLTLTQVLEADGITKDFSFNGEKEIDFIHRTTGTEEIYFLRNESEESVKSFCSFRVEGMHSELWDPGDGSIKRIVNFEAEDGLTRFDIELPAHGSVFVVFSAKKNNDIPTAGEVQVTSAQAIEGPWKVKFPAGWGAPGEMTIEKLISWTDSRNEGIKYFSGTATYLNSFTMDPGKGKGKILLDLGEMRDVAEVYINGKSAGILWKKPFRLDITDLVKEGKNELTIEVVNMWVNRLTGDMQLPPEQRICRTNQNFMTSEIWPGGDEPFRLQEAGLLGPVKIKIMEQ